MNDDIQTELSATLVNRLIKYNKIVKVLESNSRSTLKQINEATGIPKATVNIYLKLIKNRYKFTIEKRVMNNGRTI